MENSRSEPVNSIPETVKSVCNIVNENNSSLNRRNSLIYEEDNSVFIDSQSLRDELNGLVVHVNELSRRRRQILNEYLDLKGNIRVFCRVRPVGSGGDLRLAVDSDIANVIIRLTETKKKMYSFDRVFQPGSSQDEVFLEIEPVLKSVIDGYNACIFAYGQTGTGKTYTMEGTPESPGIVHRAIKGLFKQVSESNHMFVINFSMLEIYMGNLRDLLVPQPTKPSDQIPPCLLIHTDAKGEIQIENLVSIKVNDFNHVLKLYKLGCRNRATAFTNSNSASSRSHCMIRTSITCRGASERRRETNKIWLIDLGGSERVLKTKATGRRFDEGKAINLSLSALGDVINSLQHKKSHIPYRNSKLTQVLKDSLGEDSKTLMLVHISPREDDLCETICSLNFGTRAKNIHFGQEESMEEQEKKEFEMMNLQKVMEKIEFEREGVLSKIREVKERLEKISGHKSNVVLEEEDVFKEEIEFTPKIMKKSRRASDVFPSFMRQTLASSRRSSGADFNGVSGFKTRRNSSQFSRSVVKKNGSESDRSVSKSTCIMSLNVADDATVYSQDISECDIKLVVSENKRKVLKKQDRPEISKVHTWLNSQTKDISHVDDKKLVPSSPVASELRGLSGNEGLGMLSNLEKVFGSERFEELEDIEECKTEDAKMKLRVLLEYQILSKSPDVDESLNPPSVGNEGLNQFIENDRFRVEINSDQSTKPKSQIGLAFNVEYSPLLGQQEKLGEIGKVRTFMQKLEALFFRVLLGLGFMDWGYHNDFFNGLTK